MRLWVLILAQTQMRRSSTGVPKTEDEPCRSKGQTTRISAEGEEGEAGVTRAADLMPIGTNFEMLNKVVVTGLGLTDLRLFLFCFFV